MIHFAEQIRELGLSSRIEQSQYAKSVNDSLKSSPFGGISLLQGDTGLGKSLGYILPLINFFKSGDYGQVIIATASHALMYQIYNKDIPLLNESFELNGRIPPSCELLIGASSFISNDRLQRVIEEKDLNELDPLLSSLLRWTKTIDDFISEYGELPFDLTPSMICQNHFSKNDNWAERQKIKRKADIVITSHSMLIMDMLSSSMFEDKSNTLLIIDEADKLMEVMEDYKQRRLNLVSLRHLVRDDLPSHLLDYYDKMSREVISLCGTSSFIWSQKARELSDEIVTLLKSSVQYIYDDEVKHKFSTEVFSWFNKSSMDETGLGVSTVLNEPALVSVNPYFSRVFGWYLSQYRLSIMTSGTLSVTNNSKTGFKWIEKELKLRNVIKREIHSPSRYGDMAITLAGKEMPAMYLKKENNVTLSPLWIEEIARHIKMLEGRVLVLTGSHRESAQLTKAIGQISRKNVLCHKRGDKLTQLSKMYVGEDYDALITSSGHVGLNLKDADGNTAIEHIVITRLGFPKPNDEMIESMAKLIELNNDITGMADKLRRKEHYRSLNFVIRKIKQSIGRGIRSEGDYIHIHFMDNRFPLPEEQNHRYRSLIDGIPIRFMNKYLNCQRVYMDEDKFGAMI